VSAAAADGLLLLLPQQQVKDFAVAMLSLPGQQPASKRPMMPWVAS
jgi:hypothetical protein